MKQEVYFILDKNWLKDIFELSRQRHIWICKSKKNDIQIKKTWEFDKFNYKQNMGVTAFEMKDSPEVTFYHFLNSIDEHHQGSYPDIETWNKIFVFGLDFKKIDHTEIESILNTKVEINLIDDYFILSRKSTT